MAQVTSTGATVLAGGSAVVLAAGGRVTVTSDDVDVTATDGATVERVYDAGGPTVGDEVEPPPLPEG
jgi:hypothetical protein